MSIGVEFIFLIVAIIGFTLAVQRNRQRNIARGEEEYEARRRAREAQSGSEGYPAQSWGQGQANDNLQQPGNDSPSGS